MTPLEIGFIVGFVWAIVLTVWALVAVTIGEVSPLLALITYVYEGFEFTAKGILVGAGWAFADGFVSGFVIAYLFKVLTV